jgi:hypothetical protein
VKLLDVELSSFAHTAPKNRAAFLMHLQHVTLRLFPRITEDALKHHRHVSHEINGIVVHYDLPWHLQFLFTSCFFFPDRCFHRGGGSFFELPGADRAHEKMVSHCLGTSKCRVGKNSLLHNLHFPRASFIAIVKAV